MLINEVCKACSVTKKAVEYYEKQGLIKPKLNNNNYRCYDNNDLTLLKEIAMLRKLNISIADIKTIITSDDRPKALSDYKIKKELQIEQLKTQYDCLNYLLDNEYNVDKAIDTINRRLDENMVIQDKLTHSFPGYYGRYLSLHFGRFLNGKIDSDEKVLAYYRIIQFLDNIDIPEELEEFLSKYLNEISESDLQKIEESTNNVISDISNYIAKNNDNISQYLEYRNSQEFKSSPMYKMQQLLIKFKEDSRYNDIFIYNLKILSSSYREYHEKIMLANTEFLSKYPEANDIYKN
ncbi:MerR family transcriptional regulator [Brassicibacter mesophilus]|uniref:MerR family transcriptional regulator n=1 Tax=Brassicibacter mesophilus TaxID=745119 RepID=UPI003D1F5DFE